jgi:hypothetical protein
VEEIDAAAMFTGGGGDRRSGGVRRRSQIDATVFNELTDRSGGCVHRRQRR